MPHPFFGNRVLCLVSACVWLTGCSLFRPPAQKANAPTAVSAEASYQPLWARQALADQNRAQQDKLQSDLNKSESNR